METRKAARGRGTGSTHHVGGAGDAALKLSLTLIFTERCRHAVPTPSTLLNINQKRPQIVRSIGRTCPLPAAPFSEHGRSPNACDGAIGKLTAKTLRMQDVGEDLEAVKRSADRDG